MSHTIADDFFAFIWFGGETMQQHPGTDRRVGRGQSSSSIRARRTQPALPGATSPTASVVARSRPPYLVEPRKAPRKRPNYGRRAVLQLLVLGILLELLFLALYPLLAGVAPTGNIAQQALLGIFPWLPKLYWTKAFPALPSVLAHISAFNVGSSGGNANLLMLVLAIAFLLMLFAAQTGRRALRERLPIRTMRTLFSIMLLMTLLFGLTFLFLPAAMTHEMFLYGTYGRLITVYHMNPYAVSLAAFPHDLLQGGLPKNVPPTSASGPVWLDFSIPVVLLARDSIANVLFVFRLLGLIAHVANALLLWVILTKLKTELRLAATLLYAWNPLVLLFGIGEMHQDIVLVLFILLAIVFFQRNALLLGWVLILLAALMNAFCLLLLPLIFGLLPRETRAFITGRRVLWWLSLIAVSALVCVLAYAPYWSGWGIGGLLDSLQHTFWQDTAINSVDAVLLALPVKLPTWVAWLAAPQHWMIFAAITAAILLLFGYWLADKLNFVVLFSSWVMLALIALLPTYWPWYVLLPLVLTICSTSGRTLLLALLLTAGAMLSYYYLLWQPTWTGQALVTIALPMILWGWLLFFISTWDMMRARESEVQAEQAMVAAQGQGQGQQQMWRGGLSRPSMPSRPSWGGRRSR